MFFHIVDIAFPDLQKKKESVYSLLFAPIYPTRQKIFFRDKRISPCCTDVAMTFLTLFQLLASVIHRKRERGGERRKEEGERERRIAKLQLSPFVIWYEIPKIVLINNYLLYISLSSLSILPIV